MSRSDHPSSRSLSGQHAIASIRSHPIRLATRPWGIAVIVSLALFVLGSIPGISLGQLSMTWTPGTTSANGSASGTASLGYANPTYNLYGNNTATLIVDNPAIGTLPPPNLIAGGNPLLPNPEPDVSIYAYATGSGGLIDMFTGSSATATESIGGFYNLTGAPAGGAMGSLTATNEYIQDLDSIGAFKITGSATSAVTATVNVDPFPTQNPEPTPNSLTANAGFLIDSQGSGSEQTVIKTANAVVANGLHSFNLQATVTASRTGGFTGALAREDLTVQWSVSAPPPPPPPVQLGNNNGQFNNQNNNPQNLVGNQKMIALAFNPENLALDSGGNLVYPTVDPASQANQLTLAQNGLTHLLGNASGLGALCELALSPISGQMETLQSFGYDNNNYDLHHSGLLNVNLSTGQVSPITLSRPLVVPSGMAFGHGGFGATNTLVTELGDNTAPTLDSIDPAGNVTVINSQLAAAGAGDPVKLQNAPAGGFGPANPNDLFILSIGSQGLNGNLNDNTGTVTVVDNVNASHISSFLSGLDNPVSMAFGNGAILGDPSHEYLYVLETGDVDPTTGIPLGQGTLVAYDSSGNPTTLVQDILDPTSTLFSADGSTLYYTSGDKVMALTVPEPGAFAACGLAAVCFLRRRPRDPR